MAKGARDTAADAEAPAVPHHVGHRERARERFLRVGEAGLDDYELLELVLFLAIPRVDTKALAKELLARFGSYSAVLGASPERLAEVKGIKGAAATNLKIVQAAAQRFARHKVDRELPILSSWAALIDYCRAAMAYEEVEQFRVLYLDKKNRLIADEVHQTGTVDHTPVYPPARSDPPRALPRRDRADPRPQPPLGRPCPLGGGCADDAPDQRHRPPPGHHAARPCHRRQNQPRLAEGAEAVVKAQL
jgi:DNA repair protein RadC